MSVAVFCFLLFGSLVLKIEHNSTRPEGRLFCGDLGWDEALMLALTAYIILPCVCTFCSCFAIAGTEVSRTKAGQGAVQNK